MYENVAGTWEVSEWQVRLGEVSGANYHCIENMSLPLTLLALCLHLPLACRSKIQGLSHTDHSSLKHTQTVEYPPMILTVICRLYIYKPERSRIGNGPCLSMVKNLAKVKDRQAN